MGGNSPDSNVSGVTSVAWYVNTVSGISSEALAGLNDFMSKNPNLPPPFQAVIAKESADWARAKESMDEANRRLRESSSLRSRAVDWVIGAVIGAVFGLVLGKLV